MRVWLVGLTVCGIAVAIWSLYAAFSSVVGFEQESIVFTYQGVGWTGNETKREGNFRQGRHVRRPIRALLTTELAPNFVWQMETFFGPSWIKLANMTRSILAGEKPIEAELASETQTVEEPDHVVVMDLFIACEESACKDIKRLLPMCIFVNANNVSATVKKIVGVANSGWLGMGTPSRQRTSGPQCFYTETTPMQSKGDAYFQSLKFLMEPTYKHALETGAYEYILRTDVDALMMPGALTEYPVAHDVWIGRGFSGVPLTSHLLAEFTKANLHWSEAYPGAFKERVNMQSTFYLRANIAWKFTDRLIEASNRVYKEAFPEDFCKNLENTEAAQELAPGKKSLCRWPYWHKGVSTLYGTAIAANTLIKNLFITDKLDVLAAPVDEHYETDAFKLVQMHLISQKHFIQTEVKEQRDLLCKDPEVFIKDLTVKSKHSRLRALANGYLHNGGRDVNAFAGKLIFENLILRLCHKETN